MIIKINLSHYVHIDSIESISRDVHCTYQWKRKLWWNPFSDFIEVLVSKKYCVVVGLKSSNHFMLFYETESMRDKVFEQFGTVMKAHHNTPTDIHLESPL